MISGVPQGSCLGPLLFLAYDNDFDDCLAHLFVLKYADGIKMYIVFSRHSQHLSTLAVQHDLDSAVLWADTWQLNFNVDKCSTLHFGYGNENNIYHIREQQITATESQKDLGVIISQNLRFSKHVSHIVKQAEKMLAVLKRTIVTRDQKI